MIDIKYLILDEKEAIDAFKRYLAQGVPKKNISVIKKIIEDEQKHIRMLRKL